MSGDQDRIVQLVEEAVDRFGLDLDGRTVLAEAATGPYSLTPSICTVGGCDSVLLLAEDSRFGSAEVAVDAVATTADIWGHRDRLQCLDGRRDLRLREVDIILNVGFVRPIDEQLLSQVGDEVSVSLMYEPWELRERDVDLEACRRRAVPVAGVDESHEDVRTLKYLPHLALKHLFALGIEGYRSEIVVLGSGVFGDHIETGLERMGASVHRVEPGEDGWIDEIMGIETRLDGLIVAEHGSDTELIGGAGLEAHSLSERHPGVSVVHISGNIDPSRLDEAGIRYSPDRIASPFSMSVGTDDLGPRPLVDLHAAGVKVGELLVTARREGFEGQEAVRQSAKRSTLVAPVPR